MQFCVAWRWWQNFPGLIVGADADNHHTLKQFCSPLGGQIIIFNIGWQQGSSPLRIGIESDQPANRAILGAAIIF